MVREINSSCNSINFTLNLANLTIVHFIESVSIQQISYEGRNWNEEFQLLIETSYAHDTEKEYHRVQRLRKLCEQFALEAASLGKTILSELFVDDTQKSIPPITSKVFLKFMYLLHLHMP
jgi:hypothetical protein